ncbi:MAG: RNA polymerase sigma-70 factor [Bacteroidota bacterium]
MQENKHIIDEELFQRIKSDDTKALKILFEKYFSVLCCFAFKFVKTTNLAEEVVSDVFLRIWLKKEKIEIKTNLKTYLYTAVRNQSLNCLKKNKIHLEEIDTVVKENKISDLNADKLIAYEELKDDIEALLQRLPEKRQIIFKLNRIDGLSYKEIAEILSISVYTVQNQMVAAIKFLTDQHRRYK